MNGSEVSRRAVLRAAGTAAAAGAFAGCTDGGSRCSVDGVAASVVVGPGGANEFRPERVTISVGESVGWCVESAGHNVSAVPAHSDAVSIPEGAEPFASYEGDARFQTIGTGETFTHTFETPGEYTYVCIPHVSQGMIGTVVVE